MPKFDGTGPLGHGPRTGRSFGSCAFSTQRSFERHYTTRKEESENIKEEIDSLKKELQGAKERLVDLESQK